MFTFACLQLACLQKWSFWRASFYPAYQSNLKSIQKPLIGWKKAGPPKSHFCFNHVNRLNMWLLEMQWFWS